ncbi:unnamed protein product [Schistosoma turkestanicum]|nr:unnamed protein product [Schistosoma turkestanicum]
MENNSDIHKTMFISYRIQEELANGTLVGNLFNDVRKLYEKFKSTSSPASTIETTTLHSMKQLRKFELNPYDVNSKQMIEYFKLDQQTGNLLTRNPIDYEQICPKPFVHSTSTSSSSSSSLMKTLPTINSNHHELVQSSLYDCLIKLILFVSLHNSTDERWIPIIIYIEDINDNRPRFIALNSTKWSGYYPLSIKENIPIGTRIPLMKAYDLDTMESNTNILYKLNYYPDENNQIDEYHQYFDLIPCSTDSQFEQKTIQGTSHTNSPCLIIKDVLDYELKQYYFIELIACESGFTQTDCATLPIKISIIDANDNPPKIIFPVDNYYTVNVSENLPIGTLLLKIEAIDADSGENSRLTYSLIQNSLRKNLISTGTNENADDHNNRSQSTTALAQFIINPTNGEIRLNQAVHAHETQQIEITIYVADNGIPMQKISKTILFQIIDLNDHAPKIQIKKVGCGKFNVESNEIKISPNIESGSHIGFVVVSDPDLGENGQVTCDRTLEDYSHSNNNNNNNNNNWSKYSDLKINLINNGQISGQYLYTLQVVRDEEHHLNNAKNDRPNSQTIKPLDNHHRDYQYQTSSSTQALTSITMIITCQDHGRPLALTTSISLTITVTDYQQIDLCFEQNTYQLIIEESSEPMFNLLRPQLLDAISEVEFSIHDKNDKYTNGCDQLRIDPLTGEISAPSGIDREKMSFIVCSIIAKELESDLIRQNRVASAELLINVTDINDNEPKLSREILLYGFSIHEWDEYTSTVVGNNPNDPMNSYMIGFLNAIDLDLGVNGTVKYSLAHVTVEKNTGRRNATRPCFNKNNHHNNNRVDDAVKPLFQIDSTSGLLSLPRNNHQLIDWETVTAYNLQVILEDFGNPIKLTSMQTITVYVTDVNDNPPKWCNPIGSTRVPIYASKEIILYHLEPIWEINQNSPTELRSQLAAYDFDSGDNGRLQMFIIEQMTHEYQHLIDPNKLHFPMDSLYLSTNGELKLHIDRLEEIYEYYAFVRVQDQGIHRQLYTDGYFFVRLPIQTVNKLELSIHSLNTTNGNMDHLGKLMNTSQLQPIIQATWFWFNESKVIIVLIISFSLIILLSIIMIFVILTKFHKKKHRKSRKNYLHQIIDNMAQKEDALNSDYYTTNTINSSSNAIFHKNDYFTIHSNYKYDPLSLTHQPTVSSGTINRHCLPDSKQHLALNTNHFNATSPISSSLYPHIQNTNNNDYDTNNGNIGNRYSRDHIHENELDNSCVEPMIQHISAPYELFYPTVYTNLMTSYDFNENENTTTTTTTTTNMNCSSIHNYQHFNNTLQYQKHRISNPLISRENFINQAITSVSSSSSTAMMTPMMIMTTTSPNYAEHHRRVNPQLIRTKYNNETLLRQF